MLPKSLLTWQSNTLIKLWPNQCPLWFFVVCVRNHFGEWATFINDKYLFNDFGKFLFEDVFLNAYLGNMCVRALQIYAYAHADSLEREHWAQSRVLQPCSDFISILQYTKMFYFNITCFVSSHAAFHCAKFKHIAYFLTS